MDTLVNPTAYGAPAWDAFHLVIPSWPACRFSARPATTGCGPERAAPPELIDIREGGPGA
jgi:hypothetical protein